MSKFNILFYEYAHHLSSLFMLSIQFIIKWVTQEEDNKQTNKIKLVFFFLSRLINFRILSSSKTHHCTIFFFYLHTTTPPTQSRCIWIMNGSVACYVQIVPIILLIALLNTFSYQWNLRKGKQTNKEIHLLHKPITNHSPTPHFLFSVHIISIFFFCCWRFSGFSFFLLSIVIFLQILS